MKQTIRTITSHVTMPLLLVLSTVTLIFFLMLVSPSDASFVVSFFPLLLVWLIFYSLIMSTRLLFKSARKPILHTVAATIATVAMLLIMFSALGQLSVFDISLLFSLAFLGVFYFRRSWPN